MAFTAADIEAFITALHQNGELRDRVRNAILADDFLALPGIIRQLGERVDQLGERVDQLGQRMDQLGERVDQLGVRVDQLGARIDQLTARVDQLSGDVRELSSNMNLLAGRVGNLEGWRYQSHYTENVASFLAPEYRRVKRIVPGNFDPLLDLLDRGEVSRSDFDEVMRLELLASARKGRESSAPEVLLAIELSIVVDEADVRRAHRRAEILRRTGRDVLAAVDGDVILEVAWRLAAELGVTVLNAHELSAA